MDLTERKKRILRAIIESYIQSAEPVGSKAIAASIDMEVSSATIRNEMADLEAMGLATPGGHITVVDELDGRSYVWGSSNWVSLSPVTRLGHVFKVEPAHSSPWSQA